jgi:hypothetical protein
VVPEVGFNPNCATSVAVGTTLPVQFVVVSQALPVGLVKRMEGLSTAFAIGAQLSQIKPANKILARTAFALKERL